MAFILAALGMTGGGEMLCTCRLESWRACSCGVKRDIGDFGRVRTMGLYALVTLAVGGSCGRCIKGESFVIAGHY